MQLKFLKYSMYLRTVSVKYAILNGDKKSISKTSILPGSKQNILNFLTNPNKIAHLKIYFTGKNLKFKSLNI